MFNFLKKKQTEAETKTEESLIEHYRHKHMPFKKPELNRAKVVSQIFQRDFSKLMPKSKNGRAIAMDSSVCSCDLKENDIPLDILEFYGKHFFIGWQACALLRQNAYIDKACTVPAQDAISCDYKITYAENNEKTEEVDTEKLQEMKRVSDKDYNIKEICYRANVDKKTFGISLVIPVIDGVDYAKPYNIDAVKEGSYKGMTVVEPYWTAPQLDSNAVNNPMNVGFQEPTWWRMPNGTLVHKSWCVKRCNSELPDILKPTYYYGGVPLTQMIYERVYSAEKVANEAPLLALTKRLLIIDANIENLVANEAEAREKINMAQYYRDNFSMWFKNPDDQVQQIDTSLSDFDALVMTQYQLVAAIAEMPATKLLKTQPKGFNATGEFEQKDYIESLQRIQEQDFLPILKMHYELFTKSFYGKVIDLSVVFNPVDTPTEKENAEVAKIWADIDASYISAGVMSAEEVRDIRRSQEDSPYSTLADDIENEVSQEVEQVADEALDDAEFENKHNRDERGRFAKVGFNNAEPDKKGSVKNNNSNFNEWFGKSKVVDEIGNPLPVYHGGKSGIKEFDKSKISGKGQWGNGFYFTSEESEAKGFAIMAGKGEVYKAFLKIENPLTDRTLFLRIEREFDEDMTKVTQKIKEMGYDGVIMGSEYVVFEPNQIRIVKQNALDEEDDIIAWRRTKSGKPFPIRKTDKWYAEGEFNKSISEFKNGEKTGRKFCGYEEIWLDNYSDVDTAFRNDKKAWKSKNRIYKKKINGIIYTGIKDDDNLWYYIDKEAENG